MEPGAGVAWMAAFVAAVGSGRPPVGVVVAPDLSGRDEALRAAATASGRPVVRLVALAAEQAVPLAALRALHPDLDPADLVAAGARLLAAHHGAVVVVDDAHLLDETSLGVLAGLAARVEGHDLGLLVAHRPVGEPAVARLAQAVRAVGGPVVRPERLTVDEVATRLAAGTGRATTPALAESVLALTGGRLGLVDLLVAHWGAAVPDADVLATSALGPAVVEPLRTQIEVLDDDARRLLLALCLAPTHAEVVVSGSVLGQPPTPAHWEALRGAGLLSPSTPGAVGSPPSLEVPIPLVRHVVLALATPETRQELEERIGRAVADRDGPVAAAHHLRRAAAAGPEAVATFAAAARAATEPEEAARWVTEAVRVADAHDLSNHAADFATTLALAGDLAGAAQHLDRALDGDQSAVALVVAALLAHRRGQTDQAVRLFTDAAAAGHPLAGGLATPVALGAGVAPPDPGDAVTAPDDSLVGRGVARLAEAARAVVTDDPARPDAFLDAGALLAATERPVALPDPPLVLAAAAASVAGDGRLAAELVRRAREAGSLGLHRWALAAWSAWVGVGGDDAGPGPVADGGDDAGGPDPSVVPARDAVVAVAVRARGARRAGDVADLHDAWVAAEPVLIGVQPDLWLLEPAAELAAAAARLDPQRRAEAWLDAIDAIARRVGAAPAWRVALAWARLQVGLAAEDPEEVASAAGGMADLAEGHPLGRASVALVEAAAVWAEVVAGRIDAAVVESAAAALVEVGRAWDASRLVGQAAVRTTDAGVARALLVRARELAPDEGGPAAASGGSELLSEREAEVGRLVLEGRTHKEIGAQLFLSPKTIEHHVARIRTKLGAGSRAEMLAALRRELG